MPALASMEIRLPTENGSIEEISNRDIGSIIVGVLVFFAIFFELFGTPPNQLGSRGEEPPNLACPMLDFRQTRVF